MSKRIPLTIQNMDEAGEILRYLRNLIVPLPVLALAEQHSETAKRVDVARKAARNMIDFAGPVPQTEKEMRQVGMSVDMPTNEAATSLMASD